jgi:hypothetical protein
MAQKHKHKTKLVFFYKYIHDVKYKKINAKIMYKRRASKTLIAYDLANV